MALAEFETELSDDQFAFAKRELERKAWREVRGWLLMVFFLIAFLILKAALFPFSLILLPFVLAAFQLHSWAGARVWRNRDGGRLVVWLRRFHRPDLRRHPFGSLLQGACFQLATPVTIQDSTYRVAWNSLWARGTLWAVVTITLGFTMALLLVATGLLFLFFCVTLIGLSEDAAGIIVAIAAVFAGPVIVFIIVRRFVERACYRRLRTNSYRRVFGQFLENVRTGRATYALQIVQCGDDFWQTVVQEALAESNAVVIDVTELNENVRWELKEVAQLVEPYRVILCCARDEFDLLMDECELLETLSEAFGTEALAKTQRMTYTLPAPLPRWKEALVRRLRDFGLFAVLWHPQDNLRLQQALVLATSEAGHGGP